MNGLALSSTVVSQVEVATRNATLRAGPFGSDPQANSASAAQPSSVVTPARPIASRCRRDGSFQASLTSV